MFMPTRFFLNIMKTNFVSICYSYKVIHVRFVYFKDLQCLLFNIRPNYIQMSLYYSHM